MAKDRNKDINITREWVKLFLGIVLAVFGMAIVVVSLIAPPLGAVDYSVVTLFGSVLTYAGFMFGIDSNARIKIHQQEVDFEIKNKELDEKMQRFERRHGMADDQEEE